ncbi:hypothetical protein Gotur_031125 [Gossypium turneri]
MALCVLLLCYIQMPQVLVFRFYVVLFVP